MKYERVSINLESIEDNEKWGLKKEMMKVRKVYEEVPRVVSDTCRRMFRNGSGWATPPKKDLPNPVSLKTIHIKKESENKGKPSNSRNMSSV